MTRRSWVLGLCVLGGLLAVGARSAPRASADGGWWGDLDKGQGVRLADVLSNPEAYRGRALTFTCVFHQQEREFNPLRTRFNVERYDNVSVWPDGTDLWKQAAFEQDFPFVYIAHSHPQRDALTRLEMFTRIELTARIEAVVDGSPFLEVTAARATGHRLGRDVMTLMLRGEVHGRTAGAESQTLAAENFQAALDAVPDLAPLFATRIRERLAEALRNLGRNDEAARVLAGPGTPPGADPAQPAAGSTEPSTPPLGGSLPGEEVQGPPANAARGTRPSLPPPATAWPAAGSPSLPPPPPPPMPDGPIQPSLPGIPTDNLGPQGTPAMPVPSNRTPDTRPGALPPGGTAPAPAPLVAPKVIDPPLPPAPPGGLPPPRRPRLTGVK